MKDGGVEASAELDGIGAVAIPAACKAETPVAERDEVVGVEALDVGRRLGPHQVNDIRVAAPYIATRWRAPTRGPPVTFPAYHGTIAAT